MTKKIFAQPEMMVVNMKNHDIITNSPMSVLGDYNSSTVTIAAPGQRGLDDWDAGY